MKTTKKAFLSSLLALLLCITMFMGTTFAWFTDSVTSSGNKIVAGSLKVDLEVLDEKLGVWYSIKNDQDPIFFYDKWEPGYTDVTFLKVENEGTLALKWEARFISDAAVSKLAEVIDVYVLPSETELSYANATRDLDGWTKVGTLDQFINTLSQTTYGSLDAGKCAYLGIALHMQEDAGNEYQGIGLEAFDIKVVATQLAKEEDSFGPDYDEDAKWPELPEQNTASAPVTLDADGRLTADVTLTSADGSIVATVPAGTKFAQGTSTADLNVNKLAQSGANITLEENEETRSFDVHVQDLADDNTAVISIAIAEFLPVGLNMGNYKLYHVEDTATVEMRLLADGDAPVHNSFNYDPATGDVVLHLASFSEIALVAEPAKWEGNRDYSWYTNAVAPVAEGEPDYIIANADQLAALSAIVGGMAKDKEGNFLITYTDSDGDEHHNDTFSGKYIKLVADVNIGDLESENGLVFYPIGYWNSEGTYEKSNTAISSGFYTFEGTFDGNGNTISNFYQNTWEMKGDHNWYAPEEQYYRDGMGLFGKVYGGTVKNLTVDNFSSDGEIATTGVIAAYADGATFENIAITNCNPRVYNIGNGGIVGCVGWYAKEENLNTTFTNITVDNSNKISALWGSYDVACGGIVGQYYPTSGQTSAGTPKNAGIDFVNCHVAAQMDVYNDVCANYQYYAYRYTGMLIGSVRENVTIDGHVYPNMDGITASGCTVHFGDWNDYYYCELVANSLASYTHDHQFSRLEQVASVDVANKTVTDLEGNTTAIPTSGRVNYVVVKAKDANGMWIHGDGAEYATCYHFVNGVQHFHDVADTDNPNPTEIVGGVETLKEDKQLIYREFNQLFTGYGWGVTSKGLTDYEGVENMDITAGDHEASVEKFMSEIKELTTNREYTLGEIFTYLEECGIDVVDGSVNVTINNLDENGNVIATFTRGNEWAEGTISFENTGNIEITIQDYYFCTPTTIEVAVKDREPEVKFDVVMNNGDFLHRVGNSGTVAIDKLFKAKDGVTVGTVSVTVEAVNGTSASGTYSNNAIQFSGTGVVKVTITDNDYCIPTELYLEVVDAVNATGAMSATANNVVLLNNISGGFTVSGEYTVFGNGFTLNYTGNGQYLNNGLRQGVVTVSENGRLDNLRIKATIYPVSYLYYDEVKQGTYSEETTSDGTVKTRYHYQLSAVVAKDNATISNCYIYGGRNNIFIDSGNVTVADTITECGTLANIQIQSTNASTVTLENVTTIQYRVNATIGDTSAVMLGAGIIVGPDTETNPTIVLNGNFKQYNWVTAEDKENVTNSTAQTIIQTALDATAFNHTIDGVPSSNLGIIYLNNVDANVNNNTGLPYKFGNVSMLNQDGKVYSLQEATSEQIYSNCENADRSTVNGDYIPRFDFDLGNQEISYDGSEDTRYLYGDKNCVTALYQDGDDALTLDLTKLATIYKYDGINYAVTAVCKDSSGNALTATNGVVTLSALGSYTLEFTVNDNIFYNNMGETISKSITRTYAVPLNLTVKAADIKNAVVNITKTALDGVYTTVNLTDYKLRINFLDAISVTDYDNTGAGTTVDLTSNIASATLTPDNVNVFTTASTITITYNDGRVLTVNLSKISGSSAGTKTAVIKTDGDVYFITDGALNDKPTEASSQNICTITSVSYTGNSGSEVTNDTDVTVTWALGSSSGSDTSCLAEGTLITLADGTKKPVEELRQGDMVMSFDHLTGKLTAENVIIVVRTYSEHYYKNTFVFDDGTELVTINEHGIFDLDLNKYVNIDHLNYEQFIGHNFVAVDAYGNISTKKLVDVVTVEDGGYKYDIVTNGTLNYVAEDTLSVTHVLVDVINSFDFGTNLMYDAEKMQADIEKYGLYDFSEWEEYCDISVFEEYNIPVMKVGISKGLYTKEYIIGLINTYVLDDSVQIID